MNQSNGQNDESSSDYAQALKQLPLLYDDLKSHYRSLGFKAGYQARSMQANRIFELSKPLSPIHLVNVAPREKLQWRDSGFDYPVLTAWIWVDEGADLDRVLSSDDRTIRCSTPGERPFDIEVLNCDTDRPLSAGHPNVVVERFYVAKLREALPADLAESMHRMRSFFDTVLADVKSDSSRGTSVSRRST